jgi:hypothetical protein
MVSRVDLRRVARGLCPLATFSPHYDWSRLIGRWNESSFLTSVILRAVEAAVPLHYGKYTRSQGARSDRKSAGRRGKGSEPSRRLSLVICFRATRRVGAKTRHLVGLALSCGTVE